MTMHLLTRRVRATLGYDMTIADWFAHGWYLMTDPRYRKAVAALKRAFTTTEPAPADLELWNATRDLRRKEGE